MKKLILLLLFTISINILFCNELTNTFKKHNLDLSGSIGFSYGIINKVPFRGIYGGNIGISFGYQYAFNKYFAFGGGLSVILSLLYNDVYNPYKFSDIAFDGSGAVGLFMFTIGDLNKKIAFLLDVGGGWFLSAKVGIYIKGLILKIGFHNTFFFYYNNITFDIGYRFSF